ncbi:MAG: hypothetical protein ACFE7S_02325 [Candidatus Hodarchaeota archaeon]
MLQEKIEYYVKEIKKKLRLKLLHSVPKVVITDPFSTSMQSRNFGTVIRNNVVRLSREFLNSPLLEGILIRETMRAFIPEILLPIEEAIDIAIFVAYKLLPNKEEWFKQWEKVAPQKFVGDVRYWPTYDFLEYDKATSGRGIRTLLELLEEATKYRKDFKTGEYIYFFDYVQKEAFTPLKQIDIEFLEVLKQNPQISFTKLSKSISRSESMTRRIFKRLEQQIWLRIQALLNWSQINLEHIGVLLKPTDEYQKEVRERLIQPYLRKIHVLGGGRSTDFLAFYTLPTGTDYILDRFLRILRENGMIQDYTKIFSERDIQMMYFGHYNAEEKAWNIPWNELKQKFSVPFQDIQNSYPHKVIELSYKSEAKQFDDTDLKILELLYREKGLMRGVGELAKNAEISRSDLRNRLGRLRDQKFFLPKLAFLPQLCGLPETLLLFFDSDNQEAIVRIEHILQFLPLTYMLRVRGDIEGIVSFSALPGRVMAAYKTLAVQIARLPGTRSMRLYVEHQATMISRLMPIIELYVGSGQWAHPKEIWDLK